MIIDLIINTYVIDINICIDCGTELFKKNVQTEKDMFFKINGVNIHVSMIFLIGISCEAVEKLYVIKRF